MSLAKYQTKEANVSTQIWVSAEWRADWEADVAFVDDCVSISIRT